MYGENTECLKSHKGNEGHKCHEGHEGQECHEGHSLQAGSFFFGGGGIKLGKRVVGERENEPAWKPLHSEINPQIDLHLSCQM